MAAHPVLRVENLAKRYQLGTINSRLLYEQIERWWHARQARRRRSVNKLAADDEHHPREIWALRDINFELAQGEVLGLIGHNGSGKSTLLKIISQITAPTTGRVYLRGRVASLLEVGTGFHPELTGRENIFLNGAILGMSRREIATRFDEIVAFSGMDDFIDTPVKRYSSGMRVRLAFAVAAHLEAEILIIDEVLAVGDAEFQQKCLGKMGEAAQGGRTVIFVSHNLGAVQSLCTRGIALHAGGIEFDGNQTEALEFYAARHLTSGGCVRTRTDRAGSGEMRATAIELRDLQGRPASAVAAGDAVEVWVHYELRAGAKVKRVTCDLTIATTLGIPLITQSTFFSDDRLTDLRPRGAIVCRLPSVPLVEGTYRIGLGLYPHFRQRMSYDELVNAGEFQVVQSVFFTAGKMPRTVAGDGPFLVRGAWRLETEEFSS